MYINHQIVLGVDTLVHLAEAGDARVTRSDLARLLGVSAGVVGLSLWKLRAAGLILIEGKRSGMICLARAPENTLLIDVFDAMDDERPWRRHQHPEPASALGKLRGSDLIWSGGEACLRLFLHGMTLADLVDGASRFDTASIQVFRRAGGVPDWSAEC